MPSWMPPSWSPAPVAVPHPSRSRRLLSASVLLLALAPTTAAATEVAVPRLVGNGVEQKQLSGWTASISSELDFMSEFTGATEISKGDSSFNASCLASGPCLSKVARAVGCDATVAGAVSRKRGMLDFYLVYADGASIVRTKEFSVEDSTSKVADTLSVKLSELITGESAEAAAVAAAGTVDEGAFDDGFDDEDDAAMFVAPVGGTRPISSNSSGGSDELDDFDFDEDEDDRRGGAAVVAAPPPQRAPPPPPPKPAPEPEPAPAEEEFSFALGGGVVSVDEAMDDDAEEEDRRGGAIAAAGYGGSSAGTSSRNSDPAPRERPAPPPPRRESRDGYDDLDGGGGSSRDRDRDRDNIDSSSSTRVDRDRGGSKSSDAPTVSLTGRVGYSRFQAFNFVTYGAEIGIHPIDNLVVLGGIEGYSVRRDVPQDLQDQGAPPVVWNSIMPLNIGAAYKFLNDPVRPYVGGDMLIIPGYVQDAQGAAIGIRVRGGLDIMMSDNFGFNLNGAVGIWSGKEFDQLDDEFSTSALVPQFSAGTVIAF